MLTTYLNLLRVAVIQLLMFMATFNATWASPSNYRPYLCGIYFYTDECPYYFNNLNDYKVYKLYNK